MAGHPEVFDQDGASQATALGQGCPGSFFLVAAHVVSLGIGSQ